MGSDFDFVGIGDTVVDAFIRLKRDQAHTTCRIDTDACEICMPFGAKVPFDSVTVVPGVGNSANACVSATRLGLKSALITNLGDDDDGKKCFSQLVASGVDPHYIVHHPGKKTNYHYVLWYESDRTILIKHEVFPYTLPLGSKGPRWLYLSSLGDTSLPFHQEIADYLKRHPETKLAFQPGTFQIKLGTEVLRDMYARAEVFFCNIEEARTILNTTNPDVKDLLGGIHALGPNIVVLTDGPKGAYLYAGGDTYFMPPYPDAQPPYERTGAGDAFASTFIAALALGMKPEQAITWAPINSMSVVQKIGAQEGLLTREALEMFLHEAPASYKIQKL